MFGSHPLRSIRFYLLSEAEQEAIGLAPPLLSAQLQSRHWIIRGADGRELDRINGDGVVGEHPLLQAGARSNLGFRLVRVRVKV